MLTRKALVDHAIQFKNPERVPVWVDGDNIGLSDILTYDLSLPDPNDPTLSEWGFRRVRRPDGSWVVPVEPTLPEWRQVDVYQAPPQDVKRRLARVPQAAKVCGDRYRLASFGLSGYSVYSALRGAKLSADDFLIETTRFMELMELIFEFETDMFDLLARKGFHGIEFCDDWGPRKTSRITLSLWRCLLREHYAQQFKRAKEVGLHVWFSVSAECAEFYGDLREIGADVVRVETQATKECASLGRLHRGRLCFATRVDELYGQETSAQTIRNVRECLGVLTGGCIATIGANVSHENIRGIYDIVKEFKNA